MTRPSIKLLTFLFLFCTTSNAFAATYDIKENTPEVQRAVSGRQSRYSEILHLKSEGVVGETNKGYLKALKPIPGTEDLVSAENSDRKTIYEAIVTQNNLGPGGLSQVQKVFGEVQREKAKPGDSIQLPSGDWVQK